MSCTHTCVAWKRVVPNGPGAGVKSRSTLVPTWQGEGQSKQQPRKPGRTHLQRSRRNELVTTVHTDGCWYVLLSLYEVGRTLFFKQEKILVLIGLCLPLHMECCAPQLPPPKNPWPGPGPRVTITMSQAPQHAFPSCSLRARQEEASAVSVRLQASVASHFLACLWKLRADVHLTPSCLSILPHLEASWGVETVLYFCSYPRHPNLENT